MHILRLGRQLRVLLGERVGETLAGAQVVVDVSNAPSWEDNAVLASFETSGRNLLAAEAAAGVGHHVALSVVPVCHSLPRSDTPLPLPPHPESVSMGTTDAS